jgi:hypothetical protein
MEAIQQQEPLVPVHTSEADTRASFLALRCWQDAMLGDSPSDAELDQRMGEIIDEFDLLFGE